MPTRLRQVLAYLLCEFFFAHDWHWQEKQLICRRLRQADRAMKVYLIAPKTQSRLPE